jgi:hypothetical protein
VLSEKQKQVIHDRQAALSLLEKNPDIRNLSVDFNSLKSIKEAQKKIS